jgi:hypothetical protein
MIQDLVPNCSYHLEGLSRGDRINYDIAVDANEMLRIEDTVFILAACQQIRDPLETGGTYLSGGIDDFGCVILSIIFDDPAECVLDCGVIALDEVVLDEADCERGFSCDTKHSMLERAVFSCHAAQKCTGKRSSYPRTDYRQSRSSSASVRQASCRR